MPERIKSQNIKMFSEMCASVMPTFHTAAWTLPIVSTSSHDAIIFVLIYVDIDIFQFAAVELTPVAAVQYTFTHKQYTDQHNETEYTERT
jgi:hypothetical protein